MELESKQLTASKWVNTYSDLLYRFALHRVGETHTAKDLVQDTFVAAWKNIDNYRTDASVKTWLFAILKNKIIDHYRKASVRLTDELDAVVQSKSEFFDSDDHWAAGVYPQDWNADQNNSVESKEFYVILGKCRTRLKEIQNMVFTMKYLDGMESDEICKVLALTTSNYWVLVHRAKVQLRSCLEKNWFKP